MVPPMIKYKKRRQVLPAPPPPHGRPPSPPPSSGRITPPGSGSSSSISSSSISIPLPATHIHRTRSELQLADEVLRAEYDDVRMYARLVVGMQNQIARDFRDNGGVVHPLFKKSLQGVVRTKQARYDELDAENQDFDYYPDYYDRDADGRGGGGGWKVSHVEDDEDIVDSPWSAHRWDPSLPPPPKDSSDGSLLSTCESAMLRGGAEEDDDDDDDEDDFVFCLEL